MKPGVLLSLIGIDGAGKTSIAKALASLLRDRGHSPEIVSWKGVMAQDGLLAGEVLASISMAAYKLQFAEAEPVDTGCNLRAKLGVDSTEQFFRETEAELRDVSVRRNTPEALLSAALVELAGNCYLHHAHVVPIVRNGGVAIVESCGFKHVLKNALMAQRLAAPGSATHREAGETIQRASVYFGEMLKPCAGFWVDAEPRLALAWRERDSLSSTNFEDYGLTGTARDATAFVAMQSDCRVHFDWFARRWGWAQLQMTDQPKDRNLEAALSIIERSWPR